MATNASLYVFDLQVTMRDGDTFVVTMDQQDQAAFELQPFGCSIADARTRYGTYLRWTAWHAAHRQKITKLAWDGWNRAVLAVVDHVSPPAEAGPGVDDDTPLDAGQ